MDPLAIAGLLVGAAVAASYFALGVYLARTGLRVGWAAYGERERDDCRWCKGWGEQMLSNGRWRPVPEHLRLVDRPAGAINPVIANTRICPRCQGKGFNWGYRPA